MGITVIYTNSLGKSVEFSKASGIRLTSLDGISKNDITLSESSVSNQIGTTVSGASVEPKNITLEGQFKYNADTRKRLLDVILPGVSATLRISTLELGSTYTGRLNLKRHQSSHSMKPGRNFKLY